MHSATTPTAADSAHRTPRPWRQRLRALLGHDRLAHIAPLAAMTTWMLLANWRQSQRRDQPEPSAADHVL